MSATLVTPKTTSGGEIIRELSNSSDGQGLHFDGAAGNIDIATPPDLGAKFSFEFVVKADEWGSDAGYFLDFSNGGRFIFGTTSSQSYNISIYDNTSWGNFGVKVLDDLKIHHLVVTVDGTAATLYDNGNQVGTLTISASHGIDSCSDLTIGPGGTGTPMSFYRTRFYNKALTQTEVDNAYQKADVDFADQYGSQTNKISAAVDKNWGTNQADTGNDANDRATFNGNYAWTVNGTSVVDISVASNVLTFSARYNKHGIYYNAGLVAGKNQRITVNVTTVGGGEFGIYYYTGSAYVLITTLVAGDNSTEFIPTATNGYVYLGCTGDHASAKQIVLNAASIENSIVLCGAVSDFDLAFANPTQSLMVQDRAGVADGTASASGVSQTQPIVQLNSTSAVVGNGPHTPADNSLVVSGDLGIGCVPNTTANRATIEANGAWGGAFENSVSGTVKSTWKWNTSNRTEFGTSVAEPLDLITSGSPRLTIDSAGLVTVTDATESKLRLTNTKDWGSSDSGNIGTLEFYTTDASGAGARVLSAVQCAQNAGSGAPNGELVFKTALGGGSAAAAVERMRIDSSGNVLVNGGGQIKIGPSDSTAVLKLYRNDATISSDAIGDIDFGGADADNDAAARIRGKADGTWTATSSPTKLEFSTCPSGSETLATRMTIGSTGETKITRTGDEPCLELATDNAGCKLLFARAGDPTAYIRMYEDGSTGSASLRFATGTSATPVERLKISDSGQVTVGIDADPSQTASPSMLVTAATAPSDVNGYSQLVLQRSDGNTGDGAQVMFNQGYHSTNTDYCAPVGAIRGYKTGPVDAYGGGVKVLYQPDNGSLGVKTGLTLDGSGDVSFYEDTATSAKMRWDAADERLNLTGSDYQLSIRQASNAAWFLRGKSDGGLAMHLNGAGDKLSFSSAGLATFTNGIAFSQTNTTAAGATAAGTVLDHYERGTWTPKLYKGSTEHTGATVKGNYVRVGKIIYLSFYIYKSSGTESATGSWQVGGLPFNVEEDLGGAYQRINTHYFLLNGTNYFNASPHAFQANDPTQLHMYGTNSQTDWASGSLELSGSGVMLID